MSNNLRRVVYRSHSCIAHDDVVELDKIFRVSLRNNKRDQLTGGLALPDGKFVQVIEGPAPRVDDLISRLRSDVRHTNISPLGDWPVSARLFTGWAMARPDFRPINEQAFRVATVDGSGAQVVNLMASLVLDHDLLFSA